MIFKNVFFIFIVIPLQLYAFSPHPSTNVILNHQLMLVSSLLNHELEIIEIYWNLFQSRDFKLNLNIRMLIQCFGHLKIYILFHSFFNTLISFSDHHHVLSKSYHSFYSMPLRPIFNPLPWNWLELSCKTACSRSESVTLAVFGSFFFTFFIVQIQFSAFLPTPPQHPILPHPFPYFHPLLLLSMCPL